MGYDINIINSELSYKLNIWDMELVGLFISHTKGAIDSGLGEGSELENRLVSLNLFKSEARKKTDAANEDQEEIEDDVKRVIYVRKIDFQDFQNMITKNHGLPKGVLCDMEEGAEIWVGHYEEDGKPVKPPDSYKEPIKISIGHRKRIDAFCKKINLESFEKMSTNDGFVLNPKECDEICNLIHEFLETVAKKNNIEWLIELIGEESLVHIFKYAIFLELCSIKKHSIKVT